MPIPRAQDSYGYRGEDGKVFRVTGPPLSPASRLDADALAAARRGTKLEHFEQFSTNDVVGCGVVWAAQEIFFTKNGRLLGTAFAGVPGLRGPDLYPTVGLHSPGEVVRVNFGPFAAATSPTARAGVACSPAGRAPVVLLQRIFLD